MHRTCFLRTRILFLQFSFSSPEFVLRLVSFWKLTDTSPLLCSWSGSSRLPDLWADNDIWSSWWIDKTWNKTIVKRNKNRCRVPLCYFLCSSVEDRRLSWWYQVRVTSIRFDEVLYLPENYMEINIFPCEVMLRFLCKLRSSYYYYFNFRFCSFSVWVFCLHHTSQMNAISCSRSTDSIHSSLLSTVLASSALFLLLNHESLTFKVCFSAVGAWTAQVVSYFSYLVLSYPLHVFSQKFNTKFWCHIDCWS